MLIMHFCQKHDQGDGMSLSIKRHMVPTCHISSKKWATEDEIVWMASPTQLTWVWATSRREWRTGKPGMLQLTGLQRVRHNLVTQQQQQSFTCFPNGSAVKNPPANAGDAGLIPGSGRSPGEGNGNTLQYSWLGNPMDRGTWWVRVHRVARIGHNFETKQQSLS